MSNAVDNDSFLSSYTGERQRTPRPVVVKDLEAVDVQHADDCVFPVKHRVVVFDFNDAVDAAHDPAEKPLIKSLQQGDKWRCRS